MNLLGLTAESDRVPFSFGLGTDSDYSKKAAWQREVQANTDDLYDITWTDTNSGLVISGEVRILTEGLGFDYALSLTNQRNSSSEIIDSILPLDVTVEAELTEHFNLHYSLGCRSVLGDFEPQLADISGNVEVNLHPDYGRSSSGVLPFFNLAGRGGGMVFAIGWTGQWHLRCQRSWTAGIQSPLTLKAGMQQTHFYLRANESVTLPRMSFVPYCGDDWLEGQNAWRRVMSAHYMPKVQGKNVLPPVAHSTAASLHLRDNGWQGGNQSTQLESIAASSNMNIECYWLDAYWFPGAFPNGVGNWFPRPQDFPNGLKILADTAHANAMNFILWFEPERVGPDTQIEKEHEQWLLGEKGQCRLLDMGNENARQYITDLISDAISKWDVDVYRQDFNFEPLPIWRAQDRHDRQGITEIRYIEGVYTFLDELAVRHPKVWVDNCASGGRRIDIEMCKRSLVLWRSDTPDFFIWAQDQRHKSAVIDQVQTAALNLWLPYHAGGVWDVDAYHFRSAMQTGIVFYDDLRAKEFNRADAKAAIAELLSLRELFSGDYYLLTEVNTCQKQWCGYQYHRPDSDDGFAVLFRREECSESAFIAHLRALNADKHYDVRLYYSYEEAERFTIKGDELSRLNVHIPEKPGSLLLKYAAASS